MVNVLPDVVLDMNTKTVNILLIFSGTMPLQYLKVIFQIQYSPLFLRQSHLLFENCDGSIQDLGGIFMEKQIHMLLAFCSLIFNFFFKKGNSQQD